MLTLIVLILSLNNISFAFESGTFTCIEGNNPSICPQQVRAIHYNGKLVELKVLYGGECGDQGPYGFWCTDNICQGPNQTFTLLDDDHYRWQNTQHGVINECLFERM